MKPSEDWAAATAKLDAAVQQLRGSDPDSTITFDHLSPDGRSARVTMNLEQSEKLLVDMKSWLETLRKSELMQDG